MSSDPILWVHRQPPPQRTRVDAEGELVVERFPNTAAPPEDHPLHGKRVRRWERMVDNNGNVLSVVYSNAAADYDTDHHRIGRPQRRRHALLGWFAYGSCPAQLVASGAMRATLLCPENRNTRMCRAGTYDDGEGRGAMGPCPHTLAEIQYRAERNTRRENKRMAAFAKEADKIVAATKESADAQIEVSKAMLEMVKAMQAQFGLLKPNLTAEQFAAQLAAAGTPPGAAPAPVAAAPPPAAAEPMATEEELMAKLHAADVEADEEEAAPLELVPPPEPPKGKRR